MILGGTMNPTISQSWGGKCGPCQYLHHEGKVYVFSEQGDQTPMKTEGPGDAASRNAFVIVPSEFWKQNRFKAADWDDPAPKILQPRPNNYPDFSKVSLKIPTPPQTTGNSLENNAHISKRWIMGGRYHLMGVGYKLLLIIVRKKI